MLQEQTPCSGHLPLLEFAPTIPGVCAKHTSNPEMSGTLTVEGI
ncbi:MAG TPA: hypothetical protein VFG10_05950 [Saprospiraceae bacterium]|nr:hypothetical protein [Saprospiraceae bacterium]